MATVSIAGVNKVYGNNIILHDINLNIEKGEFIAIVGSSGSGKSTLLRLIAGLDEVSQGKILINGKCVNKIPPAKRDMAMVFQTYALYPHMTVYENMAYGLKMRGIKKSEILERVDVVSKMLHLEDYIHRLPSSLSGGQRQRVAMGRAIVRKPAVFLFDEPLSNLDTNLRAEMRREIKKLHAQLKTTCIYVTHDQTEAMTLADRVVVLNKGCIEQVATPKELYENPATLFVAGFIGNYPMNFLPVKIDNNQVILDKDIKFPQHTLYTHIEEGEELLLGIRPENIKIVDKPSDISIKTYIEWVDDLGADKIIHLVTEQEKLRILIRAFENIAETEDHLLIEPQINKAQLFSLTRSLKIGGWSG